MHRGFHNPPHNKIVSAPVMSARSIHECSRANSATEIKNSASKGIRITRVIVVIKSSLQPKPVQSQSCPIVASRPRGFCKCEPDPQARSTELEQVPVGHRSNWFHWSAPPGSWPLRLDSASQKV